MLKTHWKSLLVFLLLVWAVQFISVTVTLPGVTQWYPHLHTPSWTPPNWLFGPVWSVLYLMIAISGWRVYITLKDRGLSLRHPALRLWVLQLLCNLAWSCLFFSLHQIGAALADISILLVAIALTIYHTRPLDRMAAWLLAPYLLWVGYAASLNAAIHALN